MRTQRRIRNFGKHQNRIKIDGYNLIRPDHSSDSKKRGVGSIYYKEHIRLIKQDDICTLDNFLVTEIRSQNEKMFFNLFLPLTKPNP